MLVRSNRGEELNREKRCWRLAWWGSTEKIKVLCFTELRVKSRCCIQIWAPCVVSAPANREGAGRPNDQVISKNVATDKGRWRRREIVDSQFYVIFSTFCRLKRADSMNVYHYTLAFKPCFCWSITAL